MSSQGNHPSKAQSSVPRKPLGHDQMPFWKRMTETSRRFVKRDPQLGPLAFVTLGTVGLYLYFHRSKVAEVSKDKDLLRPNETKSSGQDYDAAIDAGDAPLINVKGSYYAGSGSTPRGVVMLLYPHLDKDEREHLKNLNVPQNEGIFGRTMKQTGVCDRMKKTRERGERLQEREDLAK